ncbi:hypothetical protein SH449x_001114 [Pirellulaceae bacterium SH449]
MKRLSILALAVLGFVLGCGSTPEFTDNSRDPLAFATSFKQMVVDTVADAKESREPADSLEALVSAIDGKIDSGRVPVGDFKEVYRQILDSAKALVSECEQASNGKPAGLSNKLKDLEKLAEKLPGEVKAARSRNNM